MKKFIIRILIFTAFAITILTIALFYIPNPTIQDSMLGALTDKHELLQRTPSPKIIFIGGSNLSFGLESKKIEDHFKIPVVNASIHASIGLKYYLNDLKPYIRKGDIIVVAPEYSQFYTDSFYGNIELVSILFDIFQEGREHIDFKQWYHLSNFIPKYAAAKLKFHRKVPDSGVIGMYDRKSFNKYGDAYIHWTMLRIPIETVKPCTSKDQVYEESITFLKDYHNYVVSKQATMFLLPPVYQFSSYKNQEQIIIEIQESLTTSNLPLIAAPEDYMLHDSLFFNTPSHLTKEGVNIRTDKVIKHLSNVIPIEATAPAFFE